MHDRSLGTSGYQPTPRHTEGHPVAPAKIHKPGSKASKIKKGLLLALGLLLFCIWFSLGDLRFMFWRSPSFTGFPFGSRTYLVLIQDNYELRPTGGSILGYGLMTFSHGLYTGTTFYEVDKSFKNPGEAPLVLSALLPTDTGTAPANYDPDFRLTKDELIQEFKASQPTLELNGVIALDLHFVQNWLNLYDPDENFFTSAVTDEHPGAFIGTRLQSLTTKSIILPWRLFTVRDLIVQSFQEKHLLAAFDLDGLQDSFHSRNWDGGLPQSDTGDFLAVNEGNYGGANSDRYLTRDVRYDLSIGSKRDVLGNPVITATTTVTLTHNGTDNLPLSGAYSGYLRTMIPLSSKIITGGTVSEARKDVEVLGELVKLAPGKSVTYTYTYELPEYVWNNGVYYLHLHKQPGTDGDYYRVVVHAPADVALAAPAFTVHENTASFDTHLTSDATLSFSLLPDVNPPRPTVAAVPALNQITLTFNEALNPTSASDPSHYKVVDLNESDSTVTDVVQVLSATVEGTLVTLTTDGMTSQPGESYDVSMQDLTDLASNAMTPSPTSLTVMQTVAAPATEPEATTDTAPVEPVPAP